jgi:Zn finger protein HypA/HybF involved in hydrogenase expression
MYNNATKRKGADMQTRCQNCHRPFALSKEIVEAALDDMAVKHQEHYYNMPCPHCHKLTRVPRADLLHAAPDWKEPVTGGISE